MLYKLYIMRLKEEYEELPEEEEFNEFYKENNVEIVGEWLNKDNPKELYFITGYRDEDHYNSFVSKMQENHKYQELTKQLNERRESVKSVTLSSPEDFM